MADRRVRLILEAQVDRFNSNIRQARTEADGLKGSMKQMVNAPEMQQLGRHMTAFGAATVAGLGLATKAAIDWEVQWADVMRRTEGTPQQLQDLEDGLRGIATELPTTHAEIANVAAAAAQLGIGVNDVEEFTRVMIDMGVATNMTAEEAATSMARFANVMGTPTEEMRNLGSAIVDLGNNSATTESEIMSMAQRIAGAGQAMGMTEGEVLGIAAALSSVGVEAAAGGTAISRTMYNIDAAVTEGGEALQGFADVAGMSAQEFGKLWEDDAAMGLEAFVSGLARVAEEGGSVQATLAELGINEVRTVSALTQMASAGDFLADAIGRGNDAFGEASALGTEAGYVYDTVASQIKAFWSNIQDAAITMGQVFLPVLETTVNVLSEVVSAFAALPGPVQATIGVVALLTGGLALLAGGAILLAPSLMASATALGAFGLTAGRAQVAMGRVGRGAVGFATAFAIVGTAVAGARLLMSDFEFGVDDAARAMKHGTVEAIEFEGNIWGLGRGFDNMGEAIARTQDLNPVEKFALWGAELLGLENSLTRSEEAVSAYDQALAGMVGSGDLDGAIDGMRQLAAEAEEAGVPFTQLAHEQMPELSSALEAAGTNMDEFMSALGLQNGYIDSATGKWTEGSVSLDELRDSMSDSEEAALAAALGVEDLDDAMGDAIDPAQEMADALSEVGLAADGTIESLRTFLDLMFETGLATMSARDAQFAFEEQLRGVDDVMKQIVENEMGAVLNEAGDDFNMMTDAGKLANDTLQGIVRTGFDVASSMSEAGASQAEVEESLLGIYKESINAAEGLGLGAEEARALVRQMMDIPDGVSIDTWMSDEAERTARDLQAATLALPEGVDIATFMSDSAERQAALTQMGLENIDSEVDIMSYMSDDAFIEALATRAAVLEIPEEDVVESFMSSAARDEADATTAEILGIPEGTSITSWMSSEARSEAEALQQALNNVDGRQTRSSHIHTIIEQRRASGNNSGARDLERAAYGQGRQNSGGAVFGAGTGTSDEIPRWLSNGEHVLDAQDVQLMGGQSAVYDFRRSLADGSQANRPAGREMQPASGGAASQARQLAEAMSSSGGGAGGGGGTPIEVNINAYGPNVEDVINKGADMMFRELNERGLHVGKW